MDLTLVWNGISAFFGKFLSDSLLKFGAWKVLIFTFFTVTFPIIIKNLISDLFDVFAGIAGNISSEGVSAANVSFTGLSGYLVQALMIPDCLSIILTAIVIRISLNFIPFLR